MSKSRRRLRPGESFSRSGVRYTVSPDGAQAIADIGGQILDLMVADIAADGALDGNFTPAYESGGSDFSSGGGDCDGGDCGGGD